MSNSQVQIDADEYAAIESFVNKLIKQIGIPSLNTSGGITNKALKEMNPNTLKQLQNAKFITMNDVTTGLMVNWSFESNNFEWNFRAKINFVYSMLQLYFNFNQFNYYADAYFYLYGKSPNDVKKCAQCHNYFWIYVFMDKEKSKKKCRCKCKQHYYCNRQCQKMHWNSNHRYYCLKYKK